MIIFVKNIKLSPKKSSFILIIFASVSLFFAAQKSWAYPDFIGYGYSSCITCHYNGLGGGALNDYGRALFATEITARDIYPSSTDDEEIGAQSGFLGKSPLPWWIRPGIKYRGLWFQTNPGSSQSKEKYVNMQEDLNLNLFADKKQNLSFISTFSYADKYPPHADNNKWSWYIKESYLRWKANNNLWFYLGQMDKAFGLRNIDHTAANRSINQSTVLGQFDQSVGAIVHLTYSNWDLAGNLFLGNAYELDSEKQKGLAFTGEYQLAENFKMGGSVLASENDLTEWKLASVTSRLGLTKGSSLIFELGLKEEKNKTTSTSQLGNYIWIESLISLRRGYNLISSIETSKKDLTNSSAENLKWSLGAMIFPLPRTELRFMVVNSKIYQEASGHFDNWSLQTQAHISY
jgi:hypothetical protein